MADAPKLLGTDTLRTAYPKVNMAIDNANEALRNSEDALDKATQALANSENTQAQLDQIVIEGDSSVEAAQARVDADGNVFTTLKERLDTKETQFVNEIGILKEFGTNIKELGALGGGSDDTNAIKSSLSKKNIFIPDGTFTVQEQLSITNPITIKGQKGSKLKNINSPSGGDVSIKSDDVSLEDVEFEGTSTTQGLYTQGSIKRFRVKNSKITSAKHGIHINSSGVEDVGIIESEINADSYGILTNYNAKNGKNLNISFNKIYSRTSDAIELNNSTDLTGLNSDSFKQVKIIGNTLTSDEYGTETKSGFAIGIANTRDVVVIGNITEKSRREALHIEDDQENIVVIGNVFNGCVLDGCRILPKPGAKPPTIVGNHFIKKDLTKTDIGIWSIWDANGSIAVNIPQNYIRGFDVGIWINGKEWANVDGTVIEDCNVAIKAGETAKILGTIISVNCPTLIQAKSGSMIEKVVSKIKPTKVIEFIGTTGEVGATLKNLTAQTGDVITANAGTNTFDLFPMGSVMQGKLTVRNYGANKLMIVCDVLWDGTTLTINNMVKKRSGIFGSTIDMINNNGQLAFTVYTSSSQTVNFHYEFDGMYYVE